MLNTPNILSIFRLCLVPLFVVVYFSGIPNAPLWAAVVYVIATFTDYLDGHLARKYNCITNLGKVLDPLGDKMFTFAVLSCLTISGLIPWWILAVMAAKELSLGIGGLIIHRRAKVEIPPSNILGKTATVMFFVVCIALLLFPDIPHSAAMALICVCLAVSLTALVSYIRVYLGIMKARREKNVN